MAAAVAASYFGMGHAEAGIVVRYNRIAAGHVVKAGPSGTRIKFVVAFEQLRAASRTGIHAGFFVMQ